MSQWGALQPFLDDVRVTEIMVNAGPVWIEREGVLHATDLVLDDRTIELLVERLLAPSGRRVDRRSPFVDARQPDGSRANIVVPPAAVDGPCITIRRFGSAPRSVDAFAAPSVVALLHWAIEARGNVVVSGAAGSGKTTLLNALAQRITPGERVITIEDAAELRLRADHVVRLEARPPNSEGAGAITIRELVRNALRMRPDRLVIGEVRGAEAVEMLQAMNTGHDGSLATCHANGPLDALRRIETMVVLADGALGGAGVREHLASAIDLVVHLERGADGERRVQRVAEPDPGNPGSVRDLAVHDRVVALPTRVRRAGGSSLPDPMWLDR